MTTPAAAAAITPAAAIIPAAAAITSAATATATASAASTVTTTAVLVVAVTAGEQDRTHARNRLAPRLGQQDRGRFPGTLAAAGHPGRDKPGHDGGREGSPAPLRQAGERPYLPDIGWDLAGVRTAADGVDEVLAWCVHVDPAPVIAEVRAATPVERERPDGEHIRECARPGWPLGLVVARLCDAEDTLVRPEQLQPGFQGQRRDVLPGMARGRYVDDLEAEAERRVELPRDLRFQRAARGVEDVLDVDSRLRGHAPQDARDERPVSPVGRDRAGRTSPGPRIEIALDAGEPREG